MSHIRTYAVCPSTRMLPSRSERKRSSLLPPKPKPFSGGPQSTNSIKVHTYTCFRFPLLALHAVHMYIILQISWMKWLRTLRALLRMKPGAPSNFAQTLRWGNLHSACHILYVSFSHQHVNMRACIHTHIQHIYYPVCLCVSRFYRPRDI